MRSSKTGRYKRIFLYSCFGVAIGGPVVVVLNLDRLPWNSISRTWGTIHSYELPLPLRSPLYNAWALRFSGDLEEAEYHVDQYKNLKEFFTRNLKPGLRPIAEQDFVSPVDGTIRSLGKVTDESEIITVKGRKYKLNDLLGTDKLTDSSDLYYCNIYLGPGDYHRIHSQSNWTIKHIRHIPGTLYPVFEWAEHMWPTLFNERIVLEGTCNDKGYMSIVLVGAANVGSIELDGPVSHVDIVTNQVPTNVANVQMKELEMSAPIPVSKGDKIGCFNLGSTVVVIFEAKPDFKFNVKANEKIKLGTALGNY